jgi:hypothetical protein
MPHIFEHANFSYVEAMIIAMISQYLYQYPQVSSMYRFCFVFFWCVHSIATPPPPPGPPVHRPQMVASAAVISRLKKFCYFLCCYRFDSSMISVVDSAAELSHPLAPPPSPSPLRSFRALPPRPLFPVCLQEQPKKLGRRYCCKC